MSKVKRVKKPFKALFIQDWGTYTNETAIVVGMTIPEWSRRLARLKGIAKKDVEEIKECADSDKDERSGYFIKINSGKSLLWLNSWNNSWQDADVLIHELHHAVHFVLAKDKLFADEPEGLAYQQEYLFRQIRSKLNRLLFEKPQRRRK